MSAGTRIGLDAAPTAAATFGARRKWISGLENAINKGAEHLLSLQDKSGYWLGELEADTTLESDYIY